MKYAFEFVGGKLHGQTITDYNTAVAISNGKSEDLSEVRKVNRYAVHRVELDNQPTFDGYYGPMWGGERDINGEHYAVLRYETPEIYDMLSR